MIGRTAREEWRLNWKLVVAACAGFCFFSIMTTSLSIFMLPLSQEFGWSRTLISSGVTVAAGVAALLSPFFGVLIDRYGARKIALPGLLANMIAISAFSLANGSPLQWLGLWAFYALISISVKTTVWTSAISGMFIEGRGLALGVTLAGTAIAQIAIPPLATWLISDFGWRQAYVSLGVSCGAITLLLCYFFLFDIHDHAKRVAQASGTATSVRPAASGLTVSQALRDTALWRIALASLITFSFGTGLLIHQIAILRDAGVSMAAAAWLASLAGVVGVFGKLVSGVLLDRYNGNIVGGVTIGLAVFTYAILYATGSVSLIILAMAINGYVTGAKLQIANYLTIRFCGQRNMGVVFGALASTVSLATAIGPLVAGLIYDLHGSYAPFLLAGVVGVIISTILIFTLPRYPEFEGATCAA